MLGVSGLFNNSDSGCKCTLTDPSADTSRYPTSPFWRRCVWFYCWFQNQIKIMLWIKIKNKNKKIIKSKKIKI